FAVVGGGFAADGGGAAGGGEQVVLKRGVDEGAGGERASVFQAEAGEAAGAGMKGDGGVERFGQAGAAHGGDVGGVLGEPGVEHLFGDVRLEAVGGGGLAVGAPDALIELRRDTADGGGVFKAGVVVHI